MRAKSYLQLRLIPLVEGLIFLNENFGFGLMSKIRLWSYSGLYIHTCGQFWLCSFTSLHDIKWWKSELNGESSLITKKWLLNLLWTLIKWKILLESLQTYFRNILFPYQIEHNIHCEKKCSTYLIFISILRTLIPIKYCWVLCLLFFVL